MANNALPLYPLKFEPIYKEKVWGGRGIEQIGRSLPGDKTTLIGESWEVVDLAQTSTSGDGGGAERSVIANGSLAGSTLHDAVMTFGPRLMGKLESTKSGEFPLLVKYLDAAENISVQVHPSEAYTQTHTGTRLKSESWYIVEAEPGAAIYKGVRDGVPLDEFRHAMKTNDTEKIESFLLKVSVKAGDCHYLPSGTCHALGSGILVAEVQTPSDTTFRVYDWGRTGREMHVDQAMQCIKFGPPNVARYEKRTHIAGMFTTVSRLVMCEHFRIEKVRMSEGYEQDIPYDQPAVWMVLEGGGTIEPGGGADTVAFERGQTMLMPADMNDATVKFEHDTVWLEITFPQAMTDQIA